MATIRKRNERWHVQVRRAGFPSLTKSFISRADAQAWARETERSIDRNELPTIHRGIKLSTLAELLVRYRNEVTPKKRSSGPEGYMLQTVPVQHP
jgi:hypothetical protein